MLNIRNLLNKTLITLKTFNTSMKQSLMRNFYPVYQYSI